MFQWIVGLLTSLFHCSDYKVVLLCFPDGGSILRLIVALMRDIILGVKSFIFYFPFFNAKDYVFLKCNLSTLFFILFSSHCSDRCCGVSERDAVGSAHG